MKYKSESFLKNNNLLLQGISLFAKRQNGEPSLRKNKIIAQLFHHEKNTIYLFFLWPVCSSCTAVDAAPHISDREIIERLTRLDEKLATLGEGQKSLNKRIDDLRSDMNRRFEILSWMLGLFISIAVIILSYVLRVLWVMQKQQAQREISLKNQKEEFAFLRNLIEKLLPPKGVL